jgi:hypothetical protein
MESRSGGQGGHPLKFGQPAVARRRAGGAGARDSTAQSVITRVGSNAEGGWRPPAVFLF